MLDHRRLPAALGVGLAQTLAWASTFYLPAIVAKPIADDGVGDEGTVFLGLGLALAVSAALGPAAGHRIDVGGGRRVLVAGHLVIALGLTALAGADRLGWLLAAWLLLGVGMGIGLYDAAFAVLAACFGRQARPVISGVTLLAGCASTLSWPVTAGLVKAVGWRWACLAWAAANLALAVPCLLWGLPRSTNCQPADADPGPAPASAVALAAPRLAGPLLAIAFAATWAVATAIGAHLPALLVACGVAAGPAIAIAALVGPAQVVARIGELALQRRLSPLASARLASLGHPIGAAALLLLGPAAAPVFAVLHGAGNGILTVANGALPLEIFGPEGYGRRLGRLMVPARLAQAAAPPVFAVALSAWGSTALLICLGAALLATTALLALRGRSPTGGHATMSAMWKLA